MPVDESVWNGQAGNAPSSSLTLSLWHVKARKYLDTWRELPQDLVERDMRRQNEGTSKCYMARNSILITRGMVLCPLLTSSSSPQSDTVSRPDGGPFVLTPATSYDLAHNQFATMYHSMMRITVHCISWHLLWVDDIHSRKSQHKGTQERKKRRRKCAV